MERRPNISAVLAISNSPSETVVKSVQQQIAHGSQLKASENILMIFVHLVGWLVIYTFDAVVVGLEVLA